MREMRPAQDEQQQQEQDDRTSRPICLSIAKRVRESEMVKYGDHSARMRGAPDPLLLLLLLMPISRAKPSRQRPGTRRSS